MILVLCYNKFSLFDWRTWLGPFIRLATFFKGRGMHGEKVRWHHTAIINGAEAIEALAQGVVRHSTVKLSQYEAREYLIPTFRYNEEAAWNWLCDQEGIGYNFYLVCFVKLVYQTTGIWLLKKEPEKYDCAYIIAKMYYLFAEDVEVKELFKDYVKFDPQDFVRMWKRDGYFKKL